MQLRRQLGLPEAVGLSLSIIAPTMAMAFNVTLAVGAAGAAAPLAFAIGTVLLALVGWSFVAFAKREPGAGSAQAYVARRFGPRAGFLAGWALLLSYVCFGSGTAVLVGNFLEAALRPLGAAPAGLWLVASLASLGASLWLSRRDMQLAARLMLVLELVSVLSIIWLGVLVLKSVTHSGPLPLAPFHPDATSGWAGIGAALVFAVLSFAGFEGAATLAEETRQPERAIPVAVLGTVVLAGVFYVFAAYVQVVGFGLDHLQELAHDAAPLDTLALRYGSSGLGLALNLAAALSAFSCVLGSLNAAARMAMVLARPSGHALAQVHPKHGTPATALLACAAVMSAGVVLWAPWVGAGAYYGSIGTIGTLALILVYMGVTSAHGADALHEKQTASAVVGGLGTVVLIWPLYNSVYPVPAWPANLWPYVVVVLLVLGWGRSRSAVRSTTRD
ncbi:MAG: hypothetical protein RJB26_1071 [Pseudomonadota bacterium]|jgi:amino acid transporter